MEIRIKGFLVATDTNVAYPLSPKITTVGFEGCDLNVEGEDVDGQHAMIEFVEKDCTFLLSDLQSAKGTYVNNNRVSGVVIISHGDLIRFGNSNNYEFVVEQQQQRAQIRTSSRQPSPQLQQLVLVQQRSLDGQVNDGTLPNLVTVAGAQPATAVQLAPLRSRPNSATANNVQNADQSQPARRSSWSTQPGVASPAQLGMTITSPIPKMASPVALVKSPTPVPLANIVSPKPPSSASIPISSVSSRRSASQDLDGALHQKEERIAALTAEIGRMRALEIDNAEKDKVIQNFQIQLNDLQETLIALSSTPSRQNADISNRLRALEDEVNRRRAEIMQLKSQVAGTSHHGSVRESAGSVRLASSSSSTRTFVVDEPNSRSPGGVDRNEVEKLRNNHQSTSNLVTQLQKDMGSKDMQIVNLAAQNEALKKELRTKEVELAAVYSKVARLKDLSKYEEQMAAREKELVALREKFKTAEARGQDSLDRLNEAREELQRSRKELDDSATKCSKLQAELDAAEKLLTDLRRTERDQRADVENVINLHERFRMRLIQIVFTVPQVRVPEAEVSDDQLIELIRKLVCERSEALEKAATEAEKASDVASKRQALIDNLQKFKASLNDSMSRLHSSGLLARNLKQEIQLLQAEPVGDVVDLLKEAVLNSLTLQHTWLSDIEANLETCGVNVNLSETSHALHVASLHAKHQALLTEKNQLQTKLDEAEERVRVELKAQAARSREEQEEALKQALERERLQGDEKLQKALRELHSQAKDERQEMLARFDSEKADLTSKVEQLRLALNAKTADEEARAAQLDRLTADLNELRSREQKLLDELADAQKAASLQASSHQEQMRQHSQVSGELNERLKRVTKLTEEYELQIHELRKDKKKIEELKRQLATTEQELTEYKQNRVSPAQYQAAEKTISALKQENAQLKQSLKDQTSIIESLRQDLKGAHARLSDLKGEIPESHKQELDVSKARIFELEQEVRTLRQELKRISSCSDETEQAAKSTVSEVERLREKLFTLQEKLREKDDALEKLSEKHSRQSEDSRNKLGLLEEENKMTAELTALGAQCKGERHHQIIARQKEALNELRSRIKVLEQLRPGSKHDTAINQVVQLKKELAELKAGKQSSISKPVPPPQAMQPVQVVESLNAMLTPDAMDLQFERQAHEATMQALEISESTYLQLGRALAAALSVDHLEGQKSLTYMPVDERERVSAERERACELLVARIKVLKETMSRKDDLVQEHEKLLAKLRQIEEIATKRGAQIDKLLEDLRNKTEECELLRDYMHKTKDEVEISKRSHRLPTGSSPIVSTYAPSDVKIKSLVSQRHERCQSPTSEREVLETKRRSNERVKRKNYEIQSLKKELDERQKDLSTARNKISSLEQTFGFASVENSAR